MKKFLVLVVSVITLVVMTVSPMAFAANGATENEAQLAADNLYSMGLFKGVGVKADKTPDFALDREPTRQEAVVLLIRLLGKEDKALSEKNVAPFDDVQDWAMPYVGYAYKNGLAKGVDDRKFGAQNPTASYMFITFVLRALGYEDGKDFSWLSPWDLSDQIGLVKGKYTFSTEKFTRGDAAIISNEALGMKINGSDPEKTLYEYLLEEGAIETVNVNGDENEDLIQSIINEASNVSKQNKPATSDKKGEYIGEYTLTFYCPCSKCCGKSDGITASGTKAKEGRTLAAPPGFPYNTKIYIEGLGTYTVEDRGGSIKGNRFDVFVSTHQKALNIGVIKNAKCYVVEWGQK